MLSSLSGALKSLRERSQFFFSLLPAGRWTVSPSRTAREFLEENGDEFLRCNRRLTRLAQNSSIAITSRKKSSTSSGAPRRLQVQLGFRAWNPKTQHRLLDRAPWRARGPWTRTSSSQPAAAMSSSRPLRSTSAPFCENALCSTSWNAAVLTSATLAVGGSFDYMRQRLGLEYAREVDPAVAFRL